MKDLSTLSEAIAAPRPKNQKKQTGNYRIACQTGNYRTQLPITACLYIYIAAPRPKNPKTDRQLPHCHAPPAPPDTPAKYSGDAHV
jgi:hypothetical protein